MQAISITTKYQTFHIYLFSIFYPITALGVVHIGNDNSIYTLLTLPSYYTDVLFAFLCSYAIGYYFKYIYLRNLSSTYLFSSKHFRQTLFFPLLFIMVAEASYLIFLLRIDIRHSTMWYLEIPLSLLFLLIVNFLYIIFYFRFCVPVPTAEPSEQTMILPEQFLSFLQVTRGITTFNLPISEVVYAISRQKNVYITTGEGQQYLYDEALEQLYKRLPPDMFFQINRQVIVQRKHVQSFKKTATRRLQIYTNPSLPEEAYISKLKASDFIKWLDASV